jgi:cytochrome P450
MTRATMEIRLDDPDFFLGDVEPVYRWLRAEAPVHRDPSSGLWALSKHADILRVSRDPEVFCSSRGVVVNDPLRLVGALPTPPSIIHLDPPAHNQMRRTVSRAFTPRRIAMLEPRIRELARETLDAVPAGDVFDFVEHVAMPLPMLVIAEMLGVPTGDRATFRRWSDEIIAGADATTMPGAVAELFAYFHEMVARRRVEPGEDLLSLLAVGEVEGDRLADEEILIFCMTLLVAGNETTRNLIAGGMRALIEHPEERRKLEADPSLLPSAIEEMLRWVSPIRCFARTPTRDVEIRGRRIPEGDYVVLLYAAGNRDEEVFGPTAGEFRVDRPTEPMHLAFGYGEHLCLGATLARLEARVMFGDLFARWPRLEIVGPVEVVRSTVVNGLARMPVRVRPA